MKKKSIIFYHTIPLKLNPKTASELRPKFMIDGFKDIGYEVLVIAGDYKARVKLINGLTDDQLSNIEFMYMESATIPFFLTDSNHVPSGILTELLFFAKLKRMKIPTSFFYRDIYWRFKETRYKNIFLRFILHYLFLFELYLVKFFFKIIYLPTLEMRSFIPEWDNCKVKASPPGHNLVLSEKLEVIGEKVIKLLYVGGIGGQYDLRVLLETMPYLKNVELTICTREDEWAKLVSDLNLKQSYNIQVLHKNASELKDIYESHDIFILLVNPIEYWSFTIPYKFIEAVGYGKPILCSKGIYIDKIVSKENLGWVIENKKEGIIDFFNSTIIPNEYMSKLGEVRKYSATQTWKNRCQDIINDLSSF